MGSRARPSIVAIGCVLLVAGLAAALTRAVPVRTGTNGTLVADALGGSTGRINVCQDGELIPVGTGSVRVSLSTAAGPGPALALVATDGRATIGRGTLASGWRGETATIPLRPVPHGQSPARICVMIGASASVTLLGEAPVDRNAGPPATVAGSRLDGRLRFEYLLQERHSWWSQIGGIARRMAFGHAVGDGALLSALLMLTAAGLGLWQLGRDGR